jgi:hypothetical protein
MRIALGWLTLAEARKARSRMTMYSQHFLASDSSARGRRGVGGWVVEDLCGRKVTMDLDILSLHADLLSRSCCCSLLGAVNAAYATSPLPAPSSPSSVVAITCDSAAVTVAAAAELLADVSTTTTSGVAAALTSAIVAISAVTAVAVAVSFPNHRPLVPQPLRCGHRRSHQQAACCH